VNRFLHLLNFLGVVALAVLCVVQWRSGSRDDRRLQDLEQTRVEQDARLAQQARQLAGATADMEEFRKRLVESQAALKEARAAGDAGAAQLRQATVERDQFKAAVEQWAAAVAARDQALQQAGEQTRQLAKARDEAVRRFNELVARYNVLVDQVNRAATRPATAPADP
jgi:chromosome segregation ATPase